MAAADSGYRFSANSTSERNSWRTASCGIFATASSVSFKAFSYLPSRGGPRLVELADGFGRHVRRQGGRRLTVRRQLDGQGDHGRGVIDRRRVRVVRVVVIRTAVLIAQGVGAPPGQA